MNSSRQELKRGPHCPKCCHELACLQQPTNEMLELSSLYRPGHQRTPPGYTATGWTVGTWISLVWLWSWSFVLLHFLTPLFYATGKFLKKKALFLHFFLSWNIIYWVWEMLEAACMTPVSAQWSRSVRSWVSPLLMCGPHQKHTLDKACLCSPDIFIPSPHCWHGTVALDVAVMEQHILSVKFKVCKDLCRIYMLSTPSLFQKMRTKVRV